jgi:hypothetical protein
MCSLSGPGLAEPFDELSLAEPHRPIRTGLVACEPFGAMWNRTGMSSTNCSAIPN